MKWLTNSVNLCYKSVVRVYHLIDLLLSHKGLFPMKRSAQKSPSVRLTRREALKALAAATGAMVLFNLPKTWETPIVEVGVIPAHAQGASGSPPIIHNLSGHWSSGGAPIKSNAPLPPLCEVTVTFDFSDPLGQVSGNSTIIGTYDQSTNFGGPVIPPGSFLNGTGGFSGTIRYPFNSSICSFNAVPVTVQLLVNGRYSNVTNGTVLRFV